MYGYYVWGEQRRTGPGDKPRTAAASNASALQFESAMTDNVRRVWSKGCQKNGVPNNTIGKFAPTWRMNHERLRTTWPQTLGGGGC